jgi:hypothetical protein
MTYLNQNHPVFSEDARHRSKAFEAVLALALQSSRSFVLEFDRTGVERILGSATVRALMPDLPPSSLSDANKFSYTVYHGVLDDARASLLRRVLSDEPEGLPEAVLGYIESLRLRCANGHTVLRSSDGGATILLALPPAEQLKLAAKFVHLGIPIEVLEEIEVDPDTLGP